MELSCRGFGEGTEAFAAVQSQQRSINLFFSFFFWPLSVTDRTGLILEVVFFQLNKKKKKHNLFSFFLFACGMRKNELNVKSWQYQDLQGLEVNLCKTERRMISMSCVWCASKTLNPRHVLRNIRGQRVDWTQSENLYCGSLCSSMSNGVTQPMSLQDSHISSCICT